MTFSVKILSLSVQHSLAIWQLIMFLKMWCTQDSLTAPIHNWSRIGKSIHTTFTDRGYLDVATVVHLLLTPNLTIMAT